MTPVKQTILFIHRWLGFISGLVVFIVSITGCIFCFQDEIQDALHGWRHVPAENRPYLPPSVIRADALKGYPGKAADYLYYLGKDRPALALVNTAPGEYAYVYVNPYRGNVLHHEARGDNFFNVVEDIHLYLLLPPKAGQLVVGSSVVIFVVLLITGIVLWWPKRKRDFKRSFTIKWNGRWRRVNYDLHNVLGFYAAAIALILAITGLNIAFDWAREGIYVTANLGRSYPTEKSFPASDTLNANLKAAMPVMDQAFLKAQQKSPSAQMFLIGIDERKAGAISITAYAQSLHYGNSDYYYFDQYTGKELKNLPLAKKSPGLKLNDLNYDIHVGQVGGLPGKIIAFAAGLVCASLPVTGFTVWLGKRKKPKYRGVQHAVRRRVSRAGAA